MCWGNGVLPYIAASLALGRTPCVCAFPPVKVNRWACPKVSCFLGDLAKRTCPGSGTGL